MTRTRVLLSACSLLLALVVYFGPNEQFPNSADDWSYLLQARLFASGHAYGSDALYDKANPLQRYVGTNCVTDYLGRRFSKYPPGWPLLLAVGSLVGAEWLIAPLLGALLVFLVLGDVERRIGRRFVPRAWLLLALCTFLTYTFQSFRSHTATMLCLFGAWLIYDVEGGGREALRLGQPRSGQAEGESLQTGGGEQRGHVAWRVFATGALVGYVALTRYADWIPLALWITYDLLRRKRLAHLAVFVAAFGLLASGNLWYDALLSGHAFVTPTSLGSSGGPHDQLVLSWRGFSVSAIRLGAVLYVFPPVLVLGLLTRRYWRDSRFGPYAALFVMSAGVYFFYVAAIGGPGPRYLSAYFPFLFVLTVDAWRWLSEQHAERARWLWRCAVVLQILGSIVFVGIEMRRVHERKDLDRTVARLEPGRKIVFLKIAPRAETWADFTRNPPALSSADVLYFGWEDGSGLDGLVGRFPNRRVYIYEYPGRVYHAGGTRAGPREP